jgi:RNase P subunit RPR2
MICTCEVCHKLAFAKNLEILFNSLEDEGPVVLLVCKSCAPKIKNYENGYSTV